jgi:TP901 family phage tail tape measure protein
MALKAGAVITDFKANLKNFKAGVKTAKRDLDGFGNKAKALGTKMKSMGKGLTTYVTVPLALATGAAVKFGVDFEDAMTQSTAIMTGMTKEIKKEMSDLAREMALESSQSAKELAESYYYLASAGMDAKESMASLSTVSKFATAGRFDMKVATDLLTDAQSALGLRVDDTTQSMKNMARVSDVLVRGATLANATVEQFSTSLTNRAASSLRNVNKTIEEGVAVLAAFADQGLKGRRAGMELSRTLRYMEQAARDNSEAMKQWNVEIYDGQGNLNNFADIIEDLEVAFEGLSAKQKSAALDQMGFTAETQASIKMLIGMSDQIRKYQKELKNAGGITDEVASEQMESMKEQIKLLKDSFIEMGLQLYDFARPTIEKLVIPAIQKLTGFLRGLGELFNKLPTWAKVGVGGFTMLIMALGPLLMIGGQVAIMIGGLAPVISTVTGLIAGGGGIVWAINGITTALGFLSVAATPFLVGGAVIAGVTALWQVFNKAKKASENIEGNLVEIDNLEKAQQKLKEIRESMDYIKDRASDSGGMGAGAALLERGQNVHYEELKRKEKELLKMIERLQKEKEEARDETSEDAKENSEEESEAQSKSEEEQTEKLLAELKERQQLREQFEDEWKDKLFRATHDRIEILKYEKELALEQAEDLGANKETINAYYENEITKIREQERKQREQIAQQELEQEKKLQKQKIKDRQEFEEKYEDKLRELTASRIELLKYEKEEVLQQAKQLGADKTNVYKYYEQKITDIKQEEVQTRIQLQGEEAKSEREIINKVYENISEELEIASKKNKVFGDSFDYNSRALEIYKTGINSLIEQGIYPFDYSITNLINNFETLNNKISNNNEELTSVQKIYKGLRERLKFINERFKIFGDEVDVVSESKNTLKSAIEDLIYEGLTMEDQHLKTLVERYFTLKQQATDTFDSIKQGADKATESIKKLKEESYFTHGGVYSLEEMLVRQNASFRQGFTKEEMSIDRFNRTTNNTQQSTSNTTRNNINVYNEIKDKESAKESVDNLISILEDKGLGDVL